MENSPLRPQAEPARVAAPPSLSRPKILPHYENPHNAGINKLQQEARSRLNNKKNVVVDEKRRRERTSNGITQVVRRQRRMG